MAGVPHRMFGHIDGAEACKAARWAADARRALARAWEYDEVPNLVGGPGLYLRTLIYGIAPVPDTDTAVHAEERALEDRQSVVEGQSAAVREDPCGRRYK